MFEVMERAGEADAGINRYRAHVEALAAEQRGEPAWLGRERRAALDAFVALGFPGTRHEAWRFTPTAGLAAAELAVAPRATATRAHVEALSLVGPATTELVFMNGRFAPELSRLGSLPAGLTAESMQAVLAGRGATLEGRLGSLADARRHPFTALNTASFVDGAVVTIAPHAVIDGIVHLLFLADASAGPAAMHPRVLIQAGTDSQARIVQSYHAAAGREYFTNAVVEIDLADGAVVDHYKVEQEAARAFHMASTHVRCGRASTFSSYAISLGGGWSRNETTAVLDDEGAHCTLNGVYLATDRMFVDHHTTIDHAKPHCTSHELYKGILGGEARAVFNGKIVVRPDAQKTDAKQTNKALLLSDGALINSKPELEIFANDVKCTHGAAVGQMDADAVFYLRARGLGREEAQNLLVQAFAGEVLDGVRVEALRERVTRVLLRDLAAELEKVR